MKTPLEIANAALIATLVDCTVEEATGMPFYEGCSLDVDQGLAGRVPEKVTWSADRGNWTWDGVIIALRAMGIDTAQPL